MNMDQSVEITPADPQTYFCSECETVHEENKKLGEIRVCEIPF